MDITIGVDGCRLGLARAEVGLWPVFQINQLSAVLGLEKNKADMVFGLHRMG